LFKKKQKNSRSNFFDSNVLSLSVALAIDASGVHLGSQGMPIPLARKILGEHKIIG
jgi:hypothetical protein